MHVERYRLAAEYVREAHVVDCACGTGFGSAALMQAGARSVDGVDLDREALEYARSRHALPGITFFEADALRFVPSLVPSVWVSVDTMERLPNPVAYVNHVAQLLPKGGRFIASVPVTVTTDSDQHHLHDFTRASFRALLRAHGFTEERSLEQTRQFTFANLLSRSPGLRPREHRQGLFAFYTRRPRVLGQRLAHTMTRGLVHEYLTVVAVKS